MSKQKPENQRGSPVRHKPEVFDTASIESAKRIILTPEAGTTTAERWELETPFLTRDISARLALTAASCVLDYGCGIGRLSKALIEATGCTVIGVDASAAMRRFAVEYVDSPRFICCSIDSFDVLVQQGLRADHAIAIWVLQHCLHPEVDIRRIISGLKSSGGFYVLNNRHRAVPSDRGWINDGIDIGNMLDSTFDLIEEYRLPVSVTAEAIAALTSIKVLRKC